MRCETNLAGFTLIELIMTLLIMSIISSVIGVFLFQSYQTLSNTQAINTIDNQALIALERMSNDLHAVGTASAVSNMQTNTIQFTNLAGNTITYTLSGTNLLRNGTVIANNIQNFSLTYYDRTGAITNSNSNLGLIKISMMLQLGRMQATLSSTIGMRYIL